MDTQSATITLAFDLSALNALEHPRQVVTNSYSWADNIGILTDSPLDEVIDFKTGYNIQTDFTSGARSLGDSIKETFRMIATDRHIYVGIQGSHRDTAESHNWEYLSVRQAADSADWEINDHVLANSETNSDESNQNSTGESPDSVSLSDIDESDTTDTPEIRIATHQWHLVNRGEKTVVIHPTDDTLNPGSLQSHETIILSRGLADRHRISATITAVNCYAELDAVVDDTDMNRARPTLDPQTVSSTLTDRYGTADEYITIEFETP